jgi:cytochrome bd ubiquinol oxidase subunit II
LATEFARRSFLVTILLIGIVSLLTPTLDPVYLERWFTGPTRVFSLIVPAALMALGWILWTGLRDGADNRPFAAALGIFILCFAGIGISFYPYIVPPTLTIQQAAAPDSSLEFLLAGALFLLPLILGYTAYSYWVFRGKIHPGEGYH